MRKFTIEKRPAGFVAVDVRGKVISGPHPEEWMASLYGTHAACAPTLFKSLGFRPVKTGSNYKAWQARPFGGVTALITKHPARKEWFAECSVDGTLIRYVADTRAKLCELINAHGDDIKLTRNILNPDSRDIEIARRDWGGCTDPGTERYHCM